MKNKERRQEIQEYQEIASRKVCSVANPFLMELSGWRSQLFSHEADVFLVCCVGDGEASDA